MTVRITLLRHARIEGANEICVGRRPDVDLDADGIVQAAAARARLGDPFDHVLCSPARRARSTATQWGWALDADDRLQERSFGEWEGRPWAEVWPSVQDDIKCDPARWAAFVPPNGEPVADVIERVVDALEDVISGPHRDVLVVTHGGPIRVAIAHALRLPVDRMFALGIDNARAAVLTRHPQDWTLDALNA